MKIGPVLLITMLIFAGCSSKAAAPTHFDQLKLTYKPYEKPAVERQIPIVFVLVTASSSGRREPDGNLTSFGTHDLCFANYDLSENPDRPNTKILKDVPPGSDVEPIRACITINDKQGTNYATPLQPGNYFVGLSDRQPDSIGYAGIVWDKGIKLGNRAYFKLDQMKGQLRLDSVSEDAFSGEIDLSDGENSMVGTFNGKAKIEKYIVPPLN